METIIETDRIILRRFVMEDAEAILAFNSNPEVIRYTGDRLLQTLEEAKTCVTNVWLNDYEKYGYGRFAVWYKPDQKVIGFAGLKYLPEIGETDIGYRILPEYWNKGITSEMAPPLLKYGFEELGLKRIIGITMLPNIASAKVLQKCGLKFYQQAPYLDEPEIVNWYAIDLAGFQKRYIFGENKNLNT